VGTPEEDVRGPLHMRAHHHFTRRHLRASRHCPDLQVERASQQGEVACGCRAPGTSHHAQDGGGALGGMGGQGTKGLGLSGPD
jgi:hypothetical protein